MANTASPIYELILPENTLDNNLWGTHLNADLGGVIPSSATGLDGIIAFPRIQRAAPVVGATTPIVVSSGTVQKFTVSQVTTVTLSGWAADTTPGKWAQRVWLQITNGGAFAVTWPVAITWLSGSAPVMKAAGVDVIELLTTDNGVTVYGVHHAVIDLPAINAPVVGATTTLDLKTGVDFAYTNSMIHTVAITNPTSNTRRFRLYLTNGKAFAITWPGSVTWLSGLLPILKTVGTDILEFYTPDGGTTWYGEHVGFTDTTAVMDRVKAIPSVDQAIAGGAVTPVNFQGADVYDTNNLHDPAASNGQQILVVGTGWQAVMLIGTVKISNMNTYPTINIVVRKNGVALREATAVFVPGGASSVHWTFQVVALDSSPAQNDIYDLTVQGEGSGGATIVAAGTTFELQRVA